MELKPQGCAAVVRESEVRYLDGNCSAGRGLGGAHSVVHDTGCRTSEASGTAGLPL
jgi:hypothetical protein